MGLLDRAARLKSEEEAAAPARHSGLLKRAREIAEAGEPGPGAAPEGPLEPGPGAGQTVPPTSDRPASTLPQAGLAAEKARLLEQVSSIPEGMEAPARLFALLQSAFQLSRAALLLYDPLRMVFAPWASTGLDETTCHRLRIPLGCNPRFNRVANGEPLVLREEQELADFSLFFSAREFASLDMLALVPLIAHERFVALLLVTGLAVPLDDGRFRLLQEACSAAAPLVHRARDSRLEHLPRGGAPEVAADLESSLRDTYEECRRSGQPLLLVRISLSRLMEDILRSSSFIDDFRLEEDLSRILGALLADIGRVFRLGSRHLLLAVHRMPQPDPQLLLHQLSLSMKGFFLELSRESELCFEEQVRVLPPDGPEPGPLAEGLL